MERTHDIVGDPLSPDGFGDRIEKHLRALGVTPDSYVAVKKMFGLPPRCNCKKRKVWLNKVGAKFGIGVVQ